MGTEATSGPGMTWLYFACLSVMSWGCYGILLHNGVTSMADPVNGRYKAYIFVGIAYVFVAILAPSILLWAKGASWTLPAKGMGWSLIAGVAGAMGAFGVLLAFAVKGTPPVVMTIVFAGAPIINAIISLLVHPPTAGWGAIKPQFFLGILLAALGAGLVTLYKPDSGPAKHPKPTQVQSAGEAPGQS
jgi:drug/metabolite transporter (DMT)-like permease